MKIKVITVNVWKGGELFDSLVNFLSEENPNILLLQEVYNDNNSAYSRKYHTYAELRHLLNLPYGSYSSNFIDVIDDDEKHNRGNAILSTFPITEESSV